MMKEKRKGLLQRGIMVAVSALTIVAGAGTALAYQPASSSDASFSDIVLDDSVDIFGDDSMETTIISSVDFSESDYVFIDSDGVQSICDENSTPYALCTHIMEDGKFFTHSSNSSGGCTVKVYTCQKCKKCGYRANAQYYATHTYAKCPH